MGNRGNTSTQRQVKGVKMFGQWRNKSNLEFFTDNIFDGSKVKEKMIVHEYAKKRWGVFEEHGFPGDPHFPLLYKVIL